MALQSRQTNVAATYSHDIVSALDILKPQKLPQLFSPHGNQGKANLMIRQLGWEYPVSGQEYSHFEIDDYHSSFVTATTNTAWGAGNTATLKVDPSSIFSERTYPRVNDIILFPDGSEGVITLKTKNSATDYDLEIKPLGDQAVVEIPATDAGDRLAIVSGVSGEGASFPEAAFTSVREFSYRIQITKDKVEATGTTVTDETWIEMQNYAGEYQGWYNTAFDSGEYRMLTKLNGMFWDGIDNTSHVDPNSIASVQGTLNTSQGLFSVTKERGSQETLTPSAKEEWDTFGEIFMNEFVPTETPIWTAIGYDANRKWENILFTDIPPTAGESLQRDVNDKLFKGDRTYMAFINYTGIQKNGYTYLFDVQNNWSNQATYKADPKYKYSEYTMMVPLRESKDGMEKGKWGSIGCRYKAMGDYNRKYRLDKLSGIGANAKGEPVVNDVDLTATHWMTAQGNHFTNANQFIFVTE
jgi:hypothetical protein